MWVQTPHAGNRSSRISRSGTKTISPGRRPWCGNALSRIAHGGNPPAREAAPKRFAIRRGSCKRGASCHGNCFSVDLAPQHQFPLCPAVGLLGLVTLDQKKAATFSARAQPHEMDCRGVEQVEGQWWGPTTTVPWGGNYLEHEINARKARRQSPGSRTRARVDHVVLATNPRLRDKPLKPEP